MLHQLTCETMGAAIIASHPLRTKVPKNPKTQNKAKSQAKKRELFWQSVEPPSAEEGPLVPCPPGPQPTPTI